jgi:hypothetical protein
LPDKPSRQGSLMSRDHPLGPDQVEAAEAINQPEVEKEWLEMTIFLLCAQR